MFSPLFFEINYLIYKTNDTGKKMIEINPTTFIDESELTFSTARSGGPGGQHVNKVNTKVILGFDVINSQYLSDEQKARILERLGNRITKDGILQVTSQDSRSQYANKEDAMIKLADLLREALKIHKKRRRTKVSQAAKQKRLDEKKQRGVTKKNRGKVDY